MSNGKKEKTEDASVIKPMKVRLPPPTVSKGFKNELQKITELVVEDTDKLSKEDKIKFETFSDKVDDLEKKKKKTNSKIEKQLHLPVLLLSGKKMKQDLAEITDLIEDETENLNKEEVKKVNKFLDKLDDIKKKLDNKRVQVPITRTSIKENVQRITELLTKVSNTLTEKESEEIKKLIDKMDGVTAKYDGKIDESKLKLSQRQQLQSLTLALEFTNTVKIVTNLLSKERRTLNDQEAEKIDIFIRKVDDTVGTKKRSKTAKQRETTLKPGETKSAPIFSSKISAVDETKDYIKVEREEINKNEVLTVQNERILKSSHDGRMLRLENNNVKRLQEEKDTTVNIIGAVKKKIGYRRHDKNVLNQANVCILGTEIVQKQYALERHRSQNKPIVRSTFTIVPELKCTSLPDSQTQKLSTAELKCTTHPSSRMHKISTKYYVSSKLKYLYLFS